MSPDRSRARVGLLVLASVTVLAVGSFFVGEQSQLFIRKHRYVIRFQTASGLKAANPVQLQGVDVGRVERIVLPEEVGADGLEIYVLVDRRFASRIRTDSLARIKTLGLLGDKYVELTSGSAGAEEIPDGGEIKSAPQTDVDQLIATGEDVVANVVSISHSLNTILARMERGEGLLGELTVDPEGGERLTESIVTTLASVREAADRISSGEGTIPRLINDRALADDLASSADRLDRILSSVEEGEGLLPTLLHDAEAKQKMLVILDKLSATAEDLSALALDLRDGNGLLPRLLRDDEYGQKILQDVEELIRQLREIADRLTNGDGTAALLMNDPQVYEAVQDILVGIDESAFLRWLIRNRQKAGIEKRYEETLAETEEEEGTDP